MFSRTIQRIVPQHRRFVTSSFEKDFPVYAKNIKIYIYGYISSSVYLSYVYFKNCILTKDEVHPFMGGLESITYGTIVSLIWPLSTPITVVREVARKLDKIYLEYKKKL